tara:strand:+ start:1386 stop:2474 length:1089 start_codon:yes stop_codon:yes gene_type:complete
MRIGLLKETKVGEHRVAITDIGVAELLRDNHEIFVEKDAGKSVGIKNSDYEDAGAILVSNAEEVFKRSDLLIKVKEPSLMECELLQEKQTIFCYLHLAAFPEQTKSLCRSKATAIAYETVSVENELPMLIPMSKIAGRVAMQTATYYLQTPLGGRGILLGGEDGLKQGKVVVIGGGTAGESAAKVALGIGAEVVVFDKSEKRLKELRKIFKGQVSCVLPEEGAFHEEIYDAEVVIGAVLIPGASAPKLINREMLPSMKKRSLLVDIAIDQGGCFETSKPTDHDNPVYVEEEVLHYCVANIPSAVPRTSTRCLELATLPYLKLLAKDGVEKIAQSNDHPLHSGINIHKGSIMCKPVAEAQNLN